MHDSLRCRRIVPSGRREIAWPRFTKIMAWLVGTFSFSKLSKISSPTTAGESIPILNGIWNFEMVELSRTFARWGLLNRPCVLKKKREEEPLLCGFSGKGKSFGENRGMSFSKYFRSIDEANNSRTMAKSGYDAFFLICCLRACQTYPRTARYLCWMLLSDVILDKNAY